MRYILDITHNLRSVRKTNRKFYTSKTLHLLVELHIMNTPVHFRIQIKLVLIKFIGLFRHKYLFLPSDV